MAGSIQVKITSMSAPVFGDHTAIVNVTSLNNYKGQVQMTYNPDTASVVTPSGGPPPGGEAITLSAGQSIDRTVVFSAASSGTFTATGSADNNTTGQDTAPYTV